MSVEKGDEEFLRDLLGQIGRAVEARSAGSIDREWALGSRLAGILGAQAHISIAEKLGLALAKDHDERIEVSVGGVPHAGYEVAFLRTELWVGIKESIHSVIDVPQIRDEVMARPRIGDDALPSLRYPDEDPEANGGDGEG